MKKFRVEFIRLAWNPVGKVDEIDITVESLEVALDVARRVWGRDVENSGLFKGPSASVGDVLRVTEHGTWTTRGEQAANWLIKPIGFALLDPYEAAAEVSQ